MVAVSRVVGETDLDLKSSAATDLGEPPGLACGAMSVGTAFFERQRELNTKLAWGDWSGYHAAAVFADFVDIE